MNSVFGSQRESGFPFDQSALRSLVLELPSWSRGYESMSSKAGHVEGGIPGRETNIPQSRGQLSPFATKRFISSATTKTQLSQVHK